jgi:hypothetical protein
LEAIGALNFLDLDDILVADEGELLDPRSTITLALENQWPVLPSFERSADDPFLRRLNASGKSGSSSSILRRPSFVLARCPRLGLVGKGAGPGALTRLRGGGGQGFSRLCSLAMCPVAHFRG